MAGRTSKTAEQHRIDGTHRSDRHKGDAVSVGPSLLDPPPHVEGTARAEWLRVAEQLKNAGLTTFLDHAIMEQYCVTYAMWRSAVDEAEKSGLVQVTSSGYSQQTGNFTVATKLAKELRDIAKELGMTPAARGRMRVVQEEEGQEDISSVLSRLAARECDKGT